MTTDISFECRLSKISRIYTYDFTKIITEVVRDFREILVPELLHERIKIIYEPMPDLYGGETSVNPITGSVEEILITGPFEAALELPHLKDIARLELIELLAHELLEWADEITEVGNPHDTLLDYEYTKTKTGIFQYDEDISTENIDVLIETGIRLYKQGKVEWHGYTFIWDPEAHSPEIEEFEEEVEIDEDT